LGSAIAEVLAELPGSKPLLLRIGLQDGFSSEVGDQEYLREVYGLSPGSISQRVKEVLQKIGQINNLHDLSIKVKEAIQNMQTLLLNFDQAVSSDAKERLQAALVDLRWSVYDNEL
jgi:hypothetical protein